jgi:hypothetical protein
MLDPVDSDKAIHSGSYYCCIVKPELIDEDDDTDEADSRYGRGCE